MFWRQAHKSGAEDRVLTSREDFNDLFGILQGEVNLCPDRSPDPVSLHGEDALGPPWKLITPLQKLFCIVSDFKKPLFQFLLTDTGVIRMAPPACSVAHHLFVGENRFTDLTPVHRRALLISQSSLVHPEKKELFPFIV